METLHLVLKKKWFDMIATGEKKEEYREYKPYWIRVLSTARVKIKGRYYHPTDIQVKFRHGYASDAPTMTFKCEGIRIGEPVAKWSEDSPNSFCFIIQLGKRIA